MCTACITQCMHILSLGRHLRGFTGLPLRLDRLLLLALLMLPAVPLMRSALACGTALGSGATCK